MLDRDGPHRARRWLIFEDKVVGVVGSPVSTFPAVDKGIQEAALEGFLAGYRWWYFKVALYDGLLPYG